MSARQDDLDYDHDPAEEREIARQRRRDEEHLKLLRTFYFVVAGLTAAVGCLALPHMIIGLVFLIKGPALTPPPPPPATTTATLGPTVPPAAAPAASSTGATAPTSAPATPAPVGPGTSASLPVGGVGPAPIPAPAGGPVPVAARRRAPPPAGFFQLFGSLFFLFGSLFFLFNQTVAVLMLYSAKYLRQRRRHTYLLVVAGVMLLSGIFGLVLGVFTFIVLLRPTVKELFATPAG